MFFLLLLSLNDTHFPPLLLSSHSCCHYEPLLRASTVGSAIILLIEEKEERIIFSVYFKNGRRRRKIILDGLMMSVKMLMDYTDGSTDERLNYQRHPVFLASLIKFNLYVFPLGFEKNKNLFVGILACVSTKYFHSKLIKLVSKISQFR